MFRHSTCVVCGAIPPSLGFEEKPAEEQGPPDPPSAAELKRLLAMSERPDPYCPRCQHRMALHLGRVMAGRAALGTAPDTNVARSLKVPVVLVRNIRRALGIPDPPLQRGRWSGLAPAEVAVYRDGTLSHAAAAKRAGTTTKAVRTWRERHLDELECPPPPDPVPPAVRDPRIPAEVAAELYGLTPVTVWKWRRLNPSELRRLRPEVRRRLIQRYREQAFFARMAR